MPLQQIFIRAAKILLFRLMPVKIYSNQQVVKTLFRFFEIFQGQIPAIKHRIRTKIHPFPQIYILAILTEIDLQRKMPVTEDEIIIMFRPELLFGIQSQPLLIYTHKNFICRVAPFAAMRPAIRNSHPYYRWYNRKQPLAYRISKNFSQQLIFRIARPQSVTMM